jgi:hypothetical protein
MLVGDSFLMPTPGHSWDHLWIVISNPQNHGGSFIVVNLTTDVARAGKECSLDLGEHRWITQKCYVNFADALEITPEKEAHIQTLVASKKIAMHDTLDDTILARIIAAAKQSKALPLKFRKYL